MNILVAAVPDNHVYGFQYHLEQKGHKWFWWQEEHTPAFDVFDGVRPELFIGNGVPSRAVTKCLAMYHTCPIFQTGPFTFSINNEELKFTVLVDDVVYKQNTPYPKLACDIACCDTPNPLMLSLCNPVGDFNIKISCPTEAWPVVQDIGKTTMAERLKLYQSAKIVYSDNIEELAKAAMCGAACVTSNQEIYQQLGECVWYVSTYEQLRNTCRAMLTDDAHSRISSVKTLQDTIKFNRWTYQAALTSIIVQLTQYGVFL